MFNRKFALVALLVVGIGFWSGSHRPATRLIFLAVGQGDCAIFTHAGRTIMVDAGPASTDYDAGERIVLPRLRSLGVDRIDLLVLTHPDADHIGGAGAVLKAHPEAQVVISDVFRRDSVISDRIKQWGLPESRVRWLPQDSDLAIGEVRGHFFAPRLSKGEPENDGSVFIRLTTGPASAVLTGDGSSNAESKALSEGTWEAQILKAGHHGSWHSTSSKWLSAVHPEWVVVSCGRNNSYGHPASAVLDRVARQGASLARTDRDGDIAFEVRNGRFERIR